MVERLRKTITCLKHNLSTKDLRWAAKAMDYELQQEGKRYKGSANGNANLGRPQLSCESNWWHVPSNNFRSSKASQHSETRKRCMHAPCSYNQPDSNEPKWTPSSMFGRSANTFDLKDCFPLPTHFCQQACLLPTHQYLWRKAHKPWRRHKQLSRPCPEAEWLKTEGVRFCPYHSSK